MAFTIMSSKSDNSFIGSFDPFHISHLNTRKQAEKEIGATDIVVCKNWLKTEWWLSIENRRKDIIYTLLLDPDFDSRKRDPEKIVKIAKDNETILSFINISDKVVRWIRSQDDFDYLYRLLHYYKIKDVENKGYFIPVPENLKDISSTKNKAILQEYIKEFDYIPKVYSNIFGLEVYQKLKKSCFSSDIEEATKKKIFENIHNYFTKLDTL